MTGEQPRWSVSIGYRSPNWWTENEGRGERYLQVSSGDSSRPHLTSEPVNWDEIGLSPRWFGDDTSECVAAVQPKNVMNRGSTEWGRFLLGVKQRDETALVISMIGGPEEQQGMFGESTASVDLPGTAYTSIGGPRITLASTPTLTDGLEKADRDLALRVANIRQRDASEPWWSLHMSGSYVAFGGPGPSRQMAPVGSFTPLLTSAAGEVVAGVWVSDDNAVRHYVIPWMPSWTSVLNWLSHDAIPAYVPAAKRRIHARINEEPDLQTTREQAALAELSQLENDYAARRSHLEQAVGDARAEADTLRHDLLYGSGDILKGAVQKVLEDAGLVVDDIDALLGSTGSTDLLITSHGRRRLVEVKSVSGGASESLVADALRHLNTWPQFRPDLIVDGITLVVTSQTKLHPLNRSQAVYTRREFVESLKIPVVGILDLFNAWRTEDFDTTRNLVSGLPNVVPHPAPPSVAATGSTAPPRSNRGGWRRFFART